MLVSFISPLCLYCVIWQQILEIALSKNATSLLVYNDIALYQLFGRDYLRCDLFRLRKRSNLGFFIQISDQ